MRDRYEFKIVKLDELVRPNQPISSVTSTLNLMGVDGWKPTSIKLSEGWILFIRNRV